MRPFAWFVRFIVLTALFSGLLGIAAAAGRGTSAAVVLARVDETMPMQDVLKVLLIDVERGTSISRTLYLPHFATASWNSAPPQIVQRIESRDATTFAFGALDAVRKQVLPTITYRTQNPRTHTLSVARSQSRTAIYEPTTGEVTLIAAGEPPQVAVTVDTGVTQQVLSWSPDGTRLAIKDFRGATLALVDSDGSRTIDVFRDSAPVWSPDSRYVLFTQESFLQRNGRLRVYDVAAGTIVPTVHDVPGRSGAWCDSHTIGFVRVGAGGHHSVLLLDVDTGVPAQILDEDGTTGQEILSLEFAPRAACDWLLLTMRYPNELHTRLYRLSAASGRLTLLGSNAHVLSLTGDGVVYDTNAANVALTVERAAFEEDALPEVYGRATAQIEEIMWLEGFRRGLFLRSGELWQIDLTAGESQRVPLNNRIDAVQFVAP